MIYYQSTEEVKTEGRFVTFAYGYYSFELVDGELLAFEEINKGILEKYNLKSNELNGKNFEITYTIIIDDVDDQDFVILRLEHLNLIDK